jgi:hypothetical protein
MTTTFFLWPIPILVEVLIGVAVLLQVRQVRGMRARNKAGMDNKRQTNKRSNGRFVMTIGCAGKHPAFLHLSDIPDENPASNTQPGLPGTARKHIHPPFPLSQKVISCVMSSFPLN